MTSYTVKALLNAWVSNGAMRTKPFPWYFKIFQQDHSSYIDFEKGGSNNTGSQSKCPFPLEPFITFIVQNLIIELILFFPVIQTFCEDHFLPSVMIIGLKQLACIHHSIEGQISKRWSIQMMKPLQHVREFQRRGNKSSRWILVHKDHNSSCQTFSALKCNIVNLPHWFNSSCLKIHIS